MLFGKRKKNEEPEMKSTAADAGASDVSGSVPSIANMMVSSHPGRKFNWNVPAQIASALSGFVGNQTPRAAVDEQEPQGKAPISASPDDLNASAHVTVGNPNGGGLSQITKRDKSDALDQRMRMGGNGPSNSGEFLTATIDLFRRERAGHMASFAYASPEFEGDLVRGTELWPKMARSPGYYLYWDEIKLAENCGEQIVNLLPANLKNFSVIEMGPGDVDIVQKKTHNLLKAFQRVKGPGCLKNYIAMDVDQGYATRAARETGKTFGVREDYIVSDFRKFGLRVQTEATPVMVVFGGTLFNMPKLKDAKPHHILQTYLTYLRDIIGKDGYLIVTQDVNTDEKSLLAAYDDPNGYGRETARGIMHRISRDLKTRNFSGHDFDCVVRWDRADSRVTINARAKLSKYFEVGDVPFTLQKDQEWSLVNAFKMSAETFKRNAEFAGFEHVGMVSENTNKRIVAHVLRVARLD